MTEIRPLHLQEAPLECHSFITPDGIYSPTRIMHGQRNEMDFCQSSVQKISENVSQNLLQWLDDMFLYEPNAKSQVNVLETFFQIG